MSDPVGMFPKFPYVRSKPLLKAVATLPCQICGSHGTQASHSNQAIHGKGRSIKASDIYIAALCMACHYEIDQGSRLSKAERISLWTQAHRKTIKELSALGLWPANLPKPSEH